MHPRRCAENYICMWLVGSFAGSLSASGSRIVLEGGVEGYTASDFELIGS